MTTTRGERAEAVIQILILLLIAGMAGAASFTHVHDWTMRNTPHGTGTWFGWANAIISELTPTAAGLEIRRRKRQHRPVTYPATVLAAAVILSLAAQVAQARPSPTGWLLATVPALAFLALTKLVLSRTPPEIIADNHGHTVQPPPPMAKPELEPAHTASVSQPYETTSGQLLTSAQTAAFAHQQATGQPITPVDLASRLGIPPALATSLLDAIHGTISTAAVTDSNGTPLAGNRP
jgi:hypothetical protein